LLQSLFVWLILDLAYSGDAVYLYSATDDPEQEVSVSPPPTLRSKGKDSDEFITTKVSPVGDTMDVDVQTAPSMMDQLTPNADGAQGHDSDDDNDSEGFFAVVDSFEADEKSFLPHVPVILPRRRFAGARNVATIKDGEPTLSGVSVYVS
jgi:hypothetical protein